MTTAIVPPGQLPERLRALGWRAPVYLRGAALTGAPAVAIVGARAATRSGMDRAHALARHLGDRNIDVVSGGAIGIDGAAHCGALAARGVTSVVLGSGADVFYPARHASLFREVLARGGRVLSLVPDGTQPRRGTFTRRNQLIAALADVVIVVEADVMSGSLSTAAAGRRFGRVVAAFPGSRGCERLLAAGAAIIEDVADVELALAGTPRHRAPLAIDPIADRAVRQVIDAIANGAVGVDSIVRRTGLTVRAVLRALPMIERKQ